MAHTSTNTNLLAALLLVAAGSAQPALAQTTEPTSAAAATLTVASPPAGVDGLTVIPIAAPAEASVATQGAPASVGASATPATAATAAEVPVVDLAAGPAASEATALTATAETPAEAPLGMSPDAGASAPAGKVGTLTALNAQGKITELRSSSAGDYRAQLLFYGDRLTYYVALLQQNTYWLVVATADDKRAEAVYDDFVRRTVRLSDATRHRAELEAQKAATQRMLAQAQARVDQLQADFDIAQAQREQEAALHVETARQVATLEHEQKDEQAKLIAVRRKLRAMQWRASADLPHVKTTHSTSK
jgi:hypothetical protein